MAGDTPGVFVSMRSWVSSPQSPVVSNPWGVVPEVPELEPLESIVTSSQVFGEQGSFHLSDGSLPTPLPPTPPPFGMP